MTSHSVDHGSFTIERTYPATPQRVFGAWASQPAKNTWFGEGDDFLATVTEYTLDFRIGGRERLDGTLPSGHRFTYEAVYEDVIDDQRIISPYVVSIDGRRISVSLMTIEFEAVPQGTRLVLTEQGAFLDGLDGNTQREAGASDMLDQLGAYLGVPVAA